MNAPDQTEFAEYIEDAIASELKLARAFDSDSPLQLQGRLDYIALSSIVLSGRWQIDMTFSGDGLSPVTINTIYNVSTNFAGGTACRQVAAAFPWAVQELISKLIVHPDFVRFVTPRDP